jgi:ArsR family transcriptional regulator
MSDKTLEMVAERFRVLGDPVRLALLQALANGEQTVQELTTAAGTSQANTSKHLGILLRAGLVARRKEGLFVYYRAADPEVFRLCDLVCGSLKDRLARELSQLTDSPRRRPRSRSS